MLLVLDTKVIKFMQTLHTTLEEHGLGMQGHSAPARAANLAPSLSWRHGLPMLTIMSQTTNAGLELSLKGI